MDTIAEKDELAGAAPRPQGKPRIVPFQARIAEPLVDRVRILAARRRCEPRDVVTAALKSYLPRAERRAEAASQRTS